MCHLKRSRTEEAPSVPQAMLHSGVAGMLKSLSGICLPVWQTRLDGKGQQRYLLDILVKLFYLWNRAEMFTLILENFKELFLMLTVSDNIALTDPIRDMLTSM